MNSIDETFLQYRQAGITVTATTITFSTGLLAWALSKPTSGPGSLKLEICLCIFCIAIALLSQIALFQGYKYQARAVLGYEKKENKRISNQWFSLLDKGVVISVVILIFAFVNAAVLWWPQ